MQVERFLEDSAARLPNKVALVSGSRRLTYANVNGEADRVCRLLQANGVQRGDRVVIYLENSAEAVISVFAVLKAGAVFVVVNPSTKWPKLAYLLNNSKAAGLISSVRKLRSPATRWEEAPHLRTIVAVDSDVVQLPDTGKKVVPFSAQPAGPVDASRFHCIDVDLAALIYTSGSTGHPKGVMLTHLNIVSAATSITAYLENTESDIILNTLPLSFDYGLYQVLMAFKTGATVVLERSFSYPHAVLETLVRERVTGFPIVPTIAAILRQLDLRQYDFAALRYITNTGAALPTPHLQELRTLLPHVRIYLMYGLTECKRVSYLPPDQVDARPTSVGRGMPNTDVYLVDERGTRLQSGIGELVIRGSNVMKGYWDLPEETERVLKPGPLPGERVLHSGDIFRMDLDGFLYFVGRKDDIIKTRGEKVSPKEVENVLHELPQIAEAAVVGVDDEILGHAIKAVITLRDGATLGEREVLSHCAARLENFMVPKIVEFLTSMPHTQSGKIDKKALTQAVAGQPA